MEKIKYYLEYNHGQKHESLPTGHYGIRFKKIHSLSLYGTFPVKEELVLGDHRGGLVEVIVKNFKTKKALVKIPEGNSFYVPIKDLIKA